MTRWTIVDAIGQPVFKPYTDRERAQADLVYVARRWPEDGPYRTEPIIEAPRRQRKVRT